MLKQWLSPLFYNFKHSKTVTHTDKTFFGRKFTEFLKYSSAKIAEILRFSHIQPNFHIFDNGLRIRNFWEGRGDPKIFSPSAHYYFCPPQNYFRPISNVDMAERKSLDPPKNRVFFFWGGGQRLECHDCGGLT